MTGLERHQRSLRAGQPYGTRIDPGSTDTLTLLNLPGDRLLSPRLKLGGLRRNLLKSVFVPAREPGQIGGFRFALLGWIHRTWKCRREFEMVSWPFRRRTAGRVEALLEPSCGSCWPPGPEAPEIQS